MSAAASKPTGAPINVKDYAISAAEDHLSDLVARLVKDGVSASSFVRVGNPVEEIVRFTDENAIDLVVMGTHGRSGLAHLLVGSVAERVVRAGERPAPLPIAPRLRRARRGRSLPVT